MRVLGGKGRDGHVERHPGTPRQKGGVCESVARVNYSRQPPPTREMRLLVVVRISFSLVGMPLFFWDVWLRKFNGWWAFAFFPVALDANSTCINRRPNAFFMNENLAQCTECLLPGTKLPYVLHFFMYC